MLLVAASIFALVNIRGKQENDSKAVVPYRVGSTVREIQVATPEGRSVTLELAKDRFTILFFFSGTCPSCLEEGPHWYKAVESMRDVETDFIGLTRSPHPDINSYFQESGIKFTTYWVDREFEESFHVEYYPTLYLVNPKGVITFTSQNIPLDEGLDILKLYLARED